MGWGRRRAPPAAQYDEDVYFGIKFNTVIYLNYKKTETEIKDGNCKLEWWEWINASSLSAGYRASGAKLRKWFKAYPNPQLRGWLNGNPFDEWEAKSKIGLENCGYPSKLGPMDDDINIVDNPGIEKVFQGKNQNDTLVILFAIVVKASEECWDFCDPKQTTLLRTVRIEVANGKGVKNRTWIRGGLPTWPGGFTPPEINVR
jgi:hypothetical protein